MSTALARMSEAKLRAWLLARMRGVHEDPPVAESRLEGPDDYVQLVHRETRDQRLRARLERAIVAVLQEAGARDLRTGRDARAVRFLSALVHALHLETAAPVLLSIAERGALGGHDGAIDGDAENLVLFALAGLQEPETLWPKWHALWQREVPRVWPVATAGLRLSNAGKALAILPEAVKRAERHEGLPLGEILWAFATDTRGVYKTEDLACALEGLSAAELQRCRDALRGVGAEEGEIEGWVPAPPSGAWWKRPGPSLSKTLPRFDPDKSEKLA